MTYARVRWGWPGHKGPVWHVLFGDRLISWCSRRFDAWSLETHPAPTGAPCRQCAGALERFGSEGVVSPALYEVQR